MKTSLLAGALMLSATTFAQEIVVQENFDQLTAGQPLVAQSTTWNTWNGASTYDANVTAEFSFSPSNCLLIDGTNNDIVLPLGPYTTGAYRATWKMMIPTGEGGYFNALHNWSASSTFYQWAIDVFFSPDGAISTTAAGSNQITNFSFIANEWFDIQLDIDLNNDLARVYFNNNLLREWQWSLINNNGNPGNNQLSAINFYGTEGPSGANSSGKYYIDNVSVSTFEGLVNIQQTEISANTIYPNPFMNQLTLKGNFSSVLIYSADGKLVDSIYNNSRETQVILSTAEYASGLYFIQMNSGQALETYTMMKY